MVGAPETVKRNKRTNCGGFETSLVLEDEHHPLFTSIPTLTHVSIVIMKAANAFLLAIVTSYTHAVTLHQEILKPETRQLVLTHDLIDFHKNLTQVESVTGNEKAVGEWLASSLKDQGYHVEKQNVQTDPERFNVVAWPGKRGNAKLLVTSHIDTVNMHGSIKTNYCG